MDAAQKQADFRQPHPRAHYIEFIQSYQLVISVNIRTDVSEVEEYLFMIKKDIPLLRKKMYESQY